MEDFMKRFVVIVLCLFVLAETFAIAEAQTRRRKSRFGRKARTVAIIAGGAGIGALVGGKKGAAIGGGAAGLYAFNRKAARRNFRGRTRTAGTVLSGTALGAGVGAAAGGKRAAAIGAGVGAAGSYIYSRRQRRRVRRY
jgi:Glycine zipper